jgi:hypothetical protein
MKRLFFVLAALMAVLITIVISGCGGTEIPGVTKPWPEIRNVRLYRPASILYIDTNRVSLWVNAFAFYRVAQGSNPFDPNVKRYYLDFYKDRLDVNGKSGTIVMLLSRWNNEAINNTDTYYCLIEIGAEVYMYDYKASHLVPVSKDLIDAIHRDLEQLKAENMNHFEPFLAEVNEKSQYGPALPALSREYTPTTDAYDSSLWELRPDGSSKKLQ